MIEKALECGEKAELERISLEARVTANLATLMAAANGVKHPSPRHFNDIEALLFAQQAREEIPQEVARSFVRLLKKGRVPEWVLDCVDEELIRASAGSSSE